MIMERTKESMLARMIAMNKEGDMNRETKKFAVTLFKNAQKIGNKIFLEIPLSMLKVDQEMYQRPLQSHVRIIAKNWSDDKCDPLMVNYRCNGFFYVIDGQHRFEAGSMRGLESLVCMVFVGLTLKEEADLFTEQNEGTKKLSPYDTYKANLCRGENIDVQINEVCAKHGIKVEKNNAIKTLKSVTAARSIVKGWGKENLAWIFQLMDECGWNNFKETYASDILTSINNIKVTHEDDLSYTRDKLIEFFRDSSPKELVAFANAEYPQYGRTARLNLIMKEIIEDEGRKSENIKEKIARIA